VETSEVERLWPRIAADIATATGSELVLHLTAGDVDEDGDQWWWCETVLDGSTPASFGTYWSTDSETFVARLAEYLQYLYRQDNFRPAGWGDWPICPDHGSHTLRPVVNEESIAVWKCPLGRNVAKIGALLPIP
jgi:hypothetical protein